MRITTPLELPLFIRCNPQQELSMEQERTYTDTEVTAITRIRFAVEARAAGWPADERPKVTPEDLRAARVVIDRLAREGRVD